MTLAQRLAVGGVLFLSACGGGGGGGGGVAPVAFAGTLNVSSALPAGTTTCQATTVVTFTADGADVHAVTLAGGGCLQFVNADTAPHRPAAFGDTPCTELDGPSLAKDATYTTPPLDGPRACTWQDALHPLPAGGGGGY